MKHRKRLCVNRVASTVLALRDHPNLSQSRDQRRHVPETLRTPHKHLLLSGREAALSGDRGTQRNLPLPLPTRSESHPEKGDKGVHSETCCGHSQIFSPIPEAARPEAEARA